MCILEVSLIMSDLTIETYPENWNGDEELIQRRIIEVSSGDEINQERSEAISRLKNFNAAKGNINSLRNTVDDLIKALRF